MSTMLVDQSAAADVPQHLVALQRANKVRLARVQLKRDVAAGEVTAVEVILADPWEARGMEVMELLTSQHRWGTLRASNFLASLGMPETKLLGSFTDRQRGLFADLLA